MTCVIQVGPPEGVVLEATEVLESKIKVMVVFGWLMAISLWFSMLVGHELDDFVPLTTIQADRYE